MRILQTIAEFGAHWGGITTCTYDLLSALHKQGGDVDLLTLLPKDSTDRLLGNGEEWIHALKMILLLHSLILPTLKDGWILIIPNMIYCIPMVSGCMFIMLLV